MSIFRIPELASLICHFSDSGSCARLASVCRSTFCVAVPFIWHTVDGVDKLLSLVPGTTRKYADHQRKRLVAIEIPSFTDFGRYEIYVPHIRCIDVYGKSQHFFQVIGWRILIVEWGHRLPPPNLRSLKIQTSENNKADEQLFWISAFTSASTREINIIPSNPKSGRLPWINWTTTSVMLQTIQDRCPNIERLGIYPCVTAATDRPGDKGACFLYFLYQKPFEELIGNFRNLVELSTTTAMLDLDSLSALGQLPHLESLTVYSSEDGLYDPYNGLDDGAFPALRRLSLFLIDYAEVTHALATTALVRRLVTLSINFCSNDLEDWLEEDEDVASWTTIQFLQHIKNATHLEDLSIDFDMRGERESVLALSGFTHVITQLSTLPLRKLSLQAVHISAFCFTGSRLDMAFWSSITHLRIPNLEVSNNILTRLSRLPRLQHLNVKLLISEVSAQPLEPKSRAKHGASPLRTLEGSRGSTIKADESNFDQHIKFILALWPNLEHIIWPEGAGQLEKMYVAFLNRHLKSRTRRLLSGGEETGGV